MNREIPGFYFDPEKNKYFRIQANHQVPRPAYSSSPGQSKRSGDRISCATGGGIYSHEEVKRRKREEETRKQETNLKSRKEKETIHQSPILRHPLTEASLGREVSATPLPRISSSSAIPGVNADTSRSGGNEALREERGVAVASQMERKVLVRLRDGNRRFTVRCFVRDWMSGELFVGIDEEYNFSLFSYIAMKDNETRSWKYDDLLWNPSVRMHRTQITSSLSIIPSRYLFQTMFQPSKPRSVLRMGLIGADQSRRWEKLSSGVIYWCSSPRPDSSHTPCFAVGGSEGLHTVTSTGPSHIDQDVNLVIKNVEVAAVDWLSTNVIMAGTRGSQVMLYDIRSGGSTVRAQHPHGVHSLKKVDEWRIAVAGWGNNLAIYDLRYTPKNIKANYSRSKPTYKPTNNPKSRYSHNFTKPYLTFPEYFSGDQTGKQCNIDISPELGLLASASEKNTIDLFSLRTGSRINLPSSCSSSRGDQQPTVTNYEYPERIRHLKFEYGGGESNETAPRLLVGIGDAVEEWSW